MLSLLKMDRSQQYERKDTERLKMETDNSELRGKHHPTAIVLFPDCSPETCFANPKDHPANARRNAKCSEEHLQSREGNDGDYEAATNVYGGSPEHASTSLKTALLFPAAVLHRSTRPEEGHRYTMQIGVNLGEQAEKYINCSSTEAASLLAGLPLEQQQAFRDYVTRTPAEIDFSVKRGGAMYRLLLNALEETANEATKRPWSSFVGPFTPDYSIQQSIWIDPKGPCKSKERFREHFFEAMREDGSELFALLEQLGVTKIDELRILLVCAASSAFVLHQDTNHSSVMLRTGRVLHWNIALSEDYIPGPKSARLHEDLECVRESPSVSKLHALLGPEKPDGELSINYLFGEDKVRIRYVKGKVSGASIELKPWYHTAVVPAIIRGGQVLMDWISASVRPAE
jgi:hypothetical protein